MTPTSDWRDRLAALASQLPADDEPAPQPHAATTGGGEGTASSALQANPSQPWSAQKARLDISISRKGRAGKTATIISGFTIDDDAIAGLAAHLKRSLGTGGSARGGEILIQGDRRADLLRLLTALHLPARTL